MIYRENAPGVFDSIGFTSDVQYVDDSLNNGQNYCYYVKSVGAYQDTGLCGSYHQQVSNFLQYSR
ncbi:MAG: hypothetical protein IPP46_19230 [Bacteroidetes bacterium]|nr:hypothetical protein [Bacteroidota bacterium]